MPVSALFFPGQAAQELGMDPPLPRAVKTLSAGLFRDVCLGYEGRNTVGGSDSHNPRM